MADNRSGWRVIEGVLGGAILAFFTILYTNDGFHRSVCEWVPERVNRTILCPAEFRVLSVDDARPFLERFYGRASGAEPQDAWRMMSPVARGDSSSSEFAEEWKDSLWAEVREVKETESFNRFEVSVRDYQKAGPMMPSSVPGRVLDATWTLELRRTDTGIKLHEIHEYGRDEGTNPKTTFRRVVLEDASRTYRAPRLSAKGQALSTDFKQGGLLIALCQIERRDLRGVQPVTQDDLGWWTRTAHGWIPNRVLESGDAPLADVGECDEHALLQ